MLTFLHNPHSPLSHRALAALAGAAGPLEVIDVVEATPEAAELAALVTALPVQARELLDRSGPLYFALGLDEPRWSDADVLAAAFDNPSLLRCPILIAGDRVRVEHATLEANLARPGRDGDDAAAPVLTLAAPG
ncbi:MAG: arsenate reductase family protein [Alphaproteobacteria bacterium]